MRVVCVLKWYRLRIVMWKYEHTFSSHNCYKKRASQNHEQYNIFKYLILPIKISLQMFMYIKFIILHFSSYDLTVQRSQIIT